MAAHVLLVCLLFLLRQQSTEAVENSKLLLFLIDGIRWDYINTLGLDLPGFRRIISQGVQAEYLISDFPTSSYPNYYSIMTGGKLDIRFGLRLHGGYVATTGRVYSSRAPIVTFEFFEGLHSQDHGMVANYMYDVRHNEYFMIGTNPEQYHSYWWDDGEPLWVTAEKQNKHAYMYFWPGCEVTIKGVKPTFCEKYSGVPSHSDLQSSINESLALFGNGSADLVGIFVESPDSKGHYYGTSSTQLKDAMTEIDGEMTRLMDRLKADGLEDVVNIMIFSDHGMTEVSESRIINVTNVVDMNDVNTTLEKGPLAFFWPQEGKDDKVYNDLVAANLQHVTIYKKSEIPDRWFYKNHYRTPPILLVAEEGWYILTPRYPAFSMTSVGPLKGHHGYDNALVDMRAVFYAVGPDISVGKTIKSFSNIHLYQAMCKILGIQPSKNDGDWTEIKGLLQEDETSGSSPLASVPYLLMTLIFLFRVC